MPAERYDFTIEQGATLDKTVTWTIDGVAQNLTGYTAAMHIRRRIEDTATLATLTSGNGKLILGGTAGTVQILLSASTTAAITAGDAVYDLEVTSAGGVVTKLLRGNCPIVREVTR